MKRFLVKDISQIGVMFFMFAKIQLVVSMLAVMPIMAIAETEIDGDVELDTLVVTATMGAKKIEDVPAFSTIITKDDIAKSSVSSVADLLRESTGLNNLSDESGRDDIQIRGLGGEYTVLLVNGKRVDSDGAFDKGSDVDLNTVPINSIERIEIIRGPMSVLYGADAIGGVVNIITKQPQAGEGWTGAVNTEARIVESGDGGNQYRLGVSGMGDINDKLSMSINVEGFKQKAWYADKDDLSPSQEEKETQSLTSTLMWKVADNQQVDVDFGYNNQYIPYQAYSDTAYREQEITRLDLAVTHKGQWDWADTTAFIKREESDVYDYSSQYDAPQEHDGLEANNTYAKAYANKVIGNHTLLSGVDYTSQQIINSYSISGSEYKADEYAIFAQDEIALSKDLAFTLGGRVDYHDIYGSNFSPKAYLVYSANDALTLKGGITKAFKAPDASYLSEDYSIISCGGACYLSGNPDLEAEESISYEFGFDYHTQGLNVSGSIFRNDIDNLIEREVTYDSVGDPIAAEWINVAQAMTQGLELSASTSLTDDLMVAANYTYLDTEATDSDGETTVLTGRPEHQVSLSLDYQATDILATYATINYINGMQYSTWVSGTGSVYSVLPSYYRTDIGIIADITDDLTIRAGIKNLGDVNLEEEDTGYTTYEIGRSYFASASYRF
jgi:outer membrane receptor for ferrienterochelin and colicins